MLVFSLMLSDVDGKTYEYGMLRALGFKKPYLVAMITIKSFSFSLPGCFGGVCAAYVLNVAIREAIFEQAQNSMGYSLTPLALILGVAFGLLMPFLANYLPIKAALGQNLRNSLDLNRRSEDQFGVKVQKLVDIGMSANQLMMSFTLVTLGFTVFYCVPLAFINKRITIFFMILNLLLVLIVIGLTFLCTLFFSMMEKLLLWLTLHTCCRRDKSIFMVIVKNLESHSKLNNKTSIMFTLATAFLIFSASSFELLSTILLKATEQRVGADIFGGASDKFYLDEIPIRDFLLEQMALEHKPVVDFCFSSAPLSKIM